MDITLRKLDEYRLEDFQLIAKWYNDEEIKHFISVNSDTKATEDISGELLLEKAAGNKNKNIYFIFQGLKPIGVVSIIANFEGLTFKDHETAWISICIGEKECRGKGFGKRAMELLENECKAMRYERIELGVFDFNKKAIELYKAFGYTEINVNADFTYYNGKWHDDIRMIKSL